MGRWKLRWRCKGEKCIAWRREPSTSEATFQRRLRAATGALGQIAELPGCRARCASQIWRRNERRTCQARQDRIQACSAIGQSASATKPAGTHPDGEAISRFPGNIRQGQGKTKICSKYSQSDVTLRRCARRSVEQFARSASTTTYQPGSRSESRVEVGRPREGAAHAERHLALSPTQLGTKDSFVPHFRGGCTGDAASSS